MHGLGAAVLAASTDPVDTSTHLAGRLHLDFPILEDAQHRLGSAFGDYRIGGMDMGAVDNHAIFILDARGTVRWKQLAADTMHVPDGDVIAALRRL